VGSGFPAADIINDPTRTKSQHKNKNSRQNPVKIRNFGGKNDGDESKMDENIFAPLYIARSHINQNLPRVFDNCSRRFDNLMPNCNRKRFSLTNCFPNFVQVHLLARASLRSKLTVEVDTLNRDVEDITEPSEKVFERNPLLGCRFFFVKVAK
jgi:hypothetical protein